MLKVPKFIEFNEFVKAIKLPTQDQQINELFATMSGFGHTVKGENSEVIKYVEVPILDLDTCERRFYGNLIHSNNICTSGEDRKGACHSDYGGPLVVERAGKPILIGVISFGWPICDSGKPTVHVNVAKYIEWIQDKTLSI